MKIQCDVCDQEEASVFCVADEAALCDACDHRVHHANKLAGKHHRFSLLRPSSKQSPLCDICQERRGFLFCQQDKAIFCKDCDAPIHKANEHTQKHTRFLLTGVEISSDSAPPPPPSIAESETSSLISNSASSSKNNEQPDNSKSKSKKVIPAPPPPCTPTIAKGTTDETTPESSSFSEYLMEMLPGWHVEDLLDSSPVFHSFSKNVGNELLPNWGNSREKMGIWVPEVHHNIGLSFQSGEIIAFGRSNGLREIGSDNTKFTMKKNEDSSFAVPQISHSFSNVSKRSRIL